MTDVIHELLAQIVDGVEDVAQIKLRNSDEFVPMAEVAGAPHVDRGTGFLVFGLGSEELTYLEGSLEATFDLYSCSYLQAGHTWMRKRSR